MVTNGAKHDSKKPKLTRQPALYRGLYSRVARQLGIDRSYVSRVANGQRHSPRVEQAIIRELKRIEKLKE
jgi:hypothetical protein